MKTFIYYIEVCKFPFHKAYVYRLKNNTPTHSITFKYSTFGYKKAKTEIMHALADAGLIHKKYNSKSYESYPDKKFRIVEL